MLCEQIVNWIVNNQQVYFSQSNSCLPSTELKSELKNKLMHCTSKLFLFLHEKVHLNITIPHFGSFIPTHQIATQRTNESSITLAKLLVGTNGNKGKYELRKGQYEWISDYAEHAEVGQRQAKSIVFVFFKAICDLISLGRNIQLDMQVAVLKITNRICVVRARRIRPPLHKENKQFINPYPQQEPSQRDKWNTSVGASFSKQPNLAQIKHHLDKGLHLLKREMCDLLYD